MDTGFGAVYEYLTGMGEQPAGPPYAVYYNMDMQDLDVEVAFPVARSLPGKGEIKPGRLEGGRMATCLHVGPYTELRQAYEALTQWIAENGYAANGAAYEFYLNDPDITAPQDLQTIVAFRLK
jgi:effector-binding domain-containing protein